MTTPANFLTTNRIIQYAYADAGRIAESQSPNSDELANGLNRLNDIINLWQTQGLKLCLLQDISLTLVAGQAKYVISPTGDLVMSKPTKVILANYVDSSSISRPLNPMSWEEWKRLSQTNNQGALNSYFEDKQSTHLDVYFWNVPDATAATGTIKILLKTQVQNFVSLTDTMAFPMEWAIALRWGLADDLCTGQPQEIVTRCAQRAAAFREALENQDIEDASITFVPDSRGLSQSSFS